MFRIKAPAAIILAAAIVMPLAAIAQTAPPVEKSDRAKGENRGLHRAIRWAQTELGEMDAAITALEEDAKTRTGEMRTKADEEIAKLRATRDAYAASIKEAVDDATDRGREEAAKLREATAERWAAFEGGLQDYFNTVSADLEFRRSVFEARLEAQQRAFKKRVDDLGRSAERRTEDAKAAIGRRKAELEDRLNKDRDRLHKLGRASDAAWDQLSEGLRNARVSFHEAYDAD